MWFNRNQKNRRLSRGHVLDVKLRSDQVHATRRRVVLAAISVPAVSLFGLYLLWRAGEWTLDRFVFENPEFAVQRIDITTDGVIPPEQLRRWTGVKPGANLFALDLASVKRNLKLESVLDSISVERVLPCTLKIRVTERKPIAQVNMPRAAGANDIALSVFQFDAMGVAMQPWDTQLRVVPLSQMKDAALPVITGLNAAQLQPGHRIGVPEAQAALQLIVAFSHSAMAGVVDLRRIDVSAPGIVVVTTGGGGEITFATQNLEQQLARWREIYELGRRNHKIIVSANLAVANNVPVRWIEAGGVPAATLKDSGSELMRRKNV